MWCNMFWAVLILETVGGGNRSMAFFILVHEGVPESRIIGWIHLHVNLGLCYPYKLPNGE